MNKLVHYNKFNEYFPGNSKQRIIQILIFVFPKSYAKQMYLILMNFARR